ncbi:zinc-binding dehydrogenase [Eubacteriales bacterium OttesenSCG-928-M02]|nr:zinc-binding dehydrogenase [Eubacteriales bacterium OttesenSCG-928-M02]
MAAPKNVHFGVIVEGHRAEMHQGPLRPMGPTDLLIKMEACNICTTDYQQWMGLRDHQGFPMAGGHEWAGRIIDKGSEVIDAFSIGDQVGMMYNYCGICDNCRVGLTGDCTGGTRTRAPGPDGYYGNKFFADYAVMDQRFAVKINNDIPAVEAGFLEPVATVVCGVKKVGLKPLEDIVVIGAGTMGLVNAQVARAFGARVIITEISDKKLERARKMGIADVIDSRAVDPIQAVKDLTGGKGADAVIAAVGSTIAYKQGYDMLKPTLGRLSLFPAGYPKPELDLDPNELHYRKIDIIGTIGAHAVDFVDASRLISKKLIDCSYSLEGETFPLRDIQQAYEAAATPDKYRVTVDLQGV